MRGTLRTLLLLGAASLVLGCGTAEPTQTERDQKALAMPAGFPDDVPRYPGLNIVTSSQLANDGFMIQGQTPDSTQRVADFYVTQMASKGWTRDAAGAQTPVMQLLQFKKGNRIANINVLPGGDSNTVVQLTTMLAS